MRYREREIKRRNLAPDVEIRVSLSSGKPGTFLNIHDHPSPLNLSLRIRIYT